MSATKEDVTCTNDERSAKKNYQYNTSQSEKKVLVCTETTLSGLLNIDPHNEESRKKFDEEAVMEMIRQNPATAELKCESKGRYFTGHWYPLHAAVSLGASVDVVRAILNAFPQAIKEKDRYGMTPLHCACYFQSPLDVVKFLCEKFPSAAEMKDRDAMMPLHRACWFHSIKPSKLTVEIIELLLEKYHPAALQKETSRCMTPLHMACNHRFPVEAISLLLDAAPATAMEKDKEGKTPLYLALDRYSASKEDTVSLLLEKCPKAAREKSYETRKRAGHTPFELACLFEAPLEIIKKLLVEYPHAVNDGYFTEDEEVIDIISHVDSLLNNRGSNQKEIAEKALNHFNDIEWWGGQAIVLNAYPSLVQALHIRDETLPSLFSFVGCHCELLTLWCIVRNKQDILADL